MSTCTKQVFKDTCIRVSSYSSGILDVSEFDELTFDFTATYLTTPATIALSRVQADGTISGLIGSAVLNTTTMQATLDAALSDGGTLQVVEVFGNRIQLDIQFLTTPGILSATISIKGKIRPYF